MYETVCVKSCARTDDCLNLGGGESAMVSFLHYWALSHFLTLAEWLGHTEDVERYTEMAEWVRKVWCCCIIIWRSIKAREDRPCAISVPPMCWIRWRRAL